MADYCVVVASEAQARFFTLEPVEFPEMESGPNLMDRGRINNPQKNTPDKDIYADSKTGRGRSPRGGRAHGYDDHRAQHESELGRQFARVVGEKTKQVVQDSRARRVVVAAPAQMLGYMRANLDLLARDGFEVKALSKNMIRFNSRQIHDHLARENCVPPCRKPGS